MNLFVLKLVVKEENLSFLLFFCLLGTKKLKPSIHYFSNRDYMRLPKWLKRRKKKNPFEASMPIDNPDLKIVEARYNKQPFFIGVGASKQRELKGKGEVALSAIKGEYQSQKDLTWQFLYNLKALPEGFMTEEKLKDFMASTVSVVSGGNVVVTKTLQPKETEPEELKKFVKEVEEIETEQLFRVFKDKDRDGVIIFNEKGEIVFRKKEKKESTP